jgi:hypothetical protein
MGEAGYTFTTITGGDGKPMRITTSFHLDHRSEFYVCGAGGDRVHLSIEHGDVSVRLAPRSPEQVTADDLRIVRRLVESATTYLGELERLSGEQSRRADAAA